MPIYKWEGKTLTGVIKKGEMEAPSEAASGRQLVKSMMRVQQNFKVF